MQSVWTLAGLGMLAVITAPFWWSIGRVRHDDLGFVSQQWLAEQRYSQSHAERRPQSGFRYASPGVKSTAARLFSASAIRYCDSSSRPIFFSSRSVSFSP